MVVLWLAVTGTAAAAQGVRAPAELPPPDFAGTEYTDSQGCQFVRAASNGAVVWLPRLDARRQPLCTPPAVAGGQPTDGTIAGTDPALPERATEDPQVADSAPAAPATGDVADAAPAAPEAGTGEPQGAAPPLPGPAPADPQVAGTAPADPAPGAPAQTAPTDPQLAQTAPPGPAPAPTPAEPPSLALPEPLAPLAPRVAAPRAPLDDPPGARLVYVDGPPIRIVHVALPSVLIGGQGSFDALPPVTAHARAVPTVGYHPQPAHLTVIPPIRGFGPDPEPAPRVRRAVTAPDPWRDGGPQGDDRPGILGQTASLMPAPVVN